MKRLKALLPLSVLVGLFALPGVASAAANDQITCWNQLSAAKDSVNSFPAILARVNGNDGGKAYLEDGARVYDQNILNLRSIPAKTPVFVSSLPVSMPTSTKAKAAYKRQKAKEKKVRAAMVTRAEENLQLLNKRAYEDIRDSADERELAIDRNAKQAYSDLDVLRECQEWNAESTFINTSRGAEDTYQAAQEAADAAYLANTRAAEDQYEKDTEALQDQAAYRQEMCRKDAGGTWTDTNRDGTVEWGSKNKQIPTSGVVGAYRTNAQGKLADEGFAKVVVKKVRSNDGGRGKNAVDKVVGSIPAPGSYVDPAETTVTLLVRVNKETIKGLAKGKWAAASLSAPVIIAKKGSKKPKKPKAKPIPKKPAAPSSDQIEACQEREADSAQYGSDSAMEDHSQELDRKLENEAIARNKALNTAATSFERTIADAERVLSNPFNIAIPYEQASNALDNVVDLQELRSDRQQTEDERAVEDASLEARDYLRKALNTEDINL